VFAGVFIVEEVDAQSGYTTTVDVYTLFEAFSNMSLKYACFSTGTFLW
jgi:hypothetical protein